MTVHIAPIVEGHTEVKSIKRLLARIWGELLLGGEPLAVLEPNRTSRGSLLSHRHSELREKVEQAYRLLQSRMRR
ncbi:MAG TPA: hypothetical protein VGL71_13725, partial [Urbifossiella sp.]